MKAKRNNIIRPALSAGMDWWRMEWPFSRVRKKVFSEAEFARKFPEIPQKKKAMFAKFQAPKFEIQSPKNCPAIPCPH